MRLIDADKLSEELTISDADIAFKALVDEQPTVDPVKHGHWIIHNADDPFEIFGECSVCGERQSISNRLKRCYECGSIMDEVSG